MTIPPIILGLIVAIGHSANAAESATSANTTPNAEVTVHCAAPGHIMAGGIGASWHAVRVAGRPDPKYGKWNLVGGAPQGSALQGNPPLASRAAWQDIERHAAWLGLDWVRVEVDRRMYEPSRGKYDWDNDETQTMHRILDWCQRNGADVFLTEMWRCTEWLALPGIHPVRSAPNDATAYAEGLAALAEHVLRERKYSCVKWLCLANEPNLTWLWWEGGEKKAPLEPMFAAVRAELDRRGITLPISGPDWAGIPGRPPSQSELFNLFGAIDLHSYDDAYRTNLQTWVKWSHASNRPFFMSEFGDMSLGWRRDHPGPSTFEAALSNAQKVLFGLNIGVDAFNRWSFLNRGDLDGQWQLIRTWDLKNKIYYDHVQPESAAYYGYAMLTRFTAKHSRVLDLTVSLREQAEKPPRFEVAALLSPRGQTTCIILNREPQDRAIDFRWDGLERSLQLHRYQLTESMLKDPDFRLRSDAQTNLSPEQPRLQVTVPERSITVFTSYNLAPDEPGIMSEDSASP